MYVSIGIKSTVQIEQSTITLADMPTPQTGLGNISAANVAHKAGSSPGVLELNEACLTTPYSWAFRRSDIVYKGARLNPL